MGKRALALFPLADAFSIFGKTGLFTWDGDAKASGTGAYAIPTTTESDDGTDVYFGLGLAYNITDTNVDFISAGLVFKFGKLLKRART